MKFISRSARSIATILLWLWRTTWVIVLIIGGYLVYEVLISQILDGQNVIYPFIGLWVVSAYIVLPRVHRFLSGLYIPDYFVGRTRTGDGFYSDPVNLAFFSTEEDLHAAMQKAGWVLADPITFKSMWRTVTSVLFGQSYPSAPVGRMYLFSRAHDFCYQQEVDGSPAERHHVRFWKTPDNWRLPGGHEADWLAAGTYDKSVGFSGFTLQLTHKIAANVDEERDFTVDSLKQTKLVQKVEVVKHFTSSYHTKNGGGDAINTDGSLPFITLKADR